MLQHYWKRTPRWIGRQTRKVLPHDLTKRLHGTSKENLRFLQSKALLHRSRGITKPVHINRREAKNTTTHGIKLSIELSRGNQAQMLRPRSTDSKLGPKPNRAARGRSCPRVSDQAGDSPSVLATTRPGPSTTAAASTTAHHLTAAAIPTRAQSGPHHLTGAWGGRAPP